MFPANQSILNLKLIGEYSPNWRVVSFHSEHECNGCFETGEIEFFSDKPIALPDLVQKKVCLEVNGHSVIYGIIENVVYKRYDVVGSYQQLTVVSPLYDALRSIHHRIFTHKTIQEIITEVLKSAGWPTDEISFSLSESVPFRYPSFRQHEESDWKFLHRLLHRAGWFYRIQILGSQVRLEVSDRLDRFSSKPKLLDVDRIHCVRETAQLKPAVVHAKGFCDSAPATVLSSRVSSESKLIGFGEVHQHIWDGIWGKDQLKCYAQQSSARLDHERNSLWVQTEEGGLDLWDLVQIPQEGEDKNYRVISAKYHGEELNGEKFRYYTEIELMPACAYESLFQPGVVIQHFGLLVAEVMSPFKENADMDEVGCYQVQYPSEESSYSKIARVPKASEFVHDRAGCHFPLKSGHSVVMIHREEDGNRPVILLVMQDEDRMDPVTQTNSHHHVMRSGNGHELLLDDQGSFSRLSLRTFDRSEQLLLRQQSKEECSLLELSNRKGGAQIEVAKDSHFWVDGDMVCEVQRKSDMVMHKNVLWGSASGQIRIGTQGNLMWKTNGVQDLLSQRETQLMSGDYQRWWSMYELKIRSASLCMVGGSALELSAGQVLSIGGDVTFVAGGSQLRISGGQATIQANHITVIGES